MSCPDDDNYGYFIGNCGDCLSPELDPDFWKDCNDDYQEKAWFGIWCEDWCTYWSCAGLLAEIL